jgi:CubicO group peptidase (beta-lactamase class C family)
MVLVCSAQGHSLAIAKRIDSLILARYNKSMFNGSILVQKDGELIYKRSLGWANIETRDTLKLSYPVRIASVTKTLTAVCILMLVDEGKVSLEHDVHDYLPEITKTGITIHHLLSHTSGIAAINGGGHFDKIGSYLEEREEYRFTNADVLRYFKEYQPEPLAEPGAKYSYSNVSYTILASIVERISGMKYADYLEKNIFIPCKMESSFLYLPNTKNNNPEKVFSYLRTEEEGYKREEVYYKYDDQGELLYSNDIYGDKYICSTVEDMNLFNKALLDGQLLQLSTVEKMLTPVLLNNGKPTADKQGYGIYQNTRTDRFFYEHSGAIGAYEVLNMFDLKGTQIILMLNIENGEFFRIASAVEDILENKKEQKTYKGRKEKLPKAKSAFLPVFNQKYKINYTPLYD